MLKNPTPKDIGLLSSVSVTGAAVLIFAAVYVALKWLPAWLVFAGAAVLVFLATYVVTSFYLKMYIYRKIKVIYKVIRQQKMSAKEKSADIDISRPLLDDVAEEVEAWADDQQKELDKYKSWAEYRRRFVGDISHELKTPIFNIQGFIHTLLDGALEDPQVNRPYLERASKNLDRLTTIVEDLEAISKYESGELVLEMRSFDLRKLAEEVFEDLEFKAARKNIKLEFKEGLGQTCRVRADRESIRQVLINLVNNSIKYGNANGRTKIGYYDMDRNVLIEVADNGIGIPEDKLVHVFDRFYRVDESRSREQGGSGLGLAIVKHIVEAHQQTITVRSSPNLGSTFGFTLEKA
jgi:two-component system, OmpR family, phosphate regulon sensor histidine kinase PhoR